MKLAPLNNKSYYCFLESSLSIDDIINFSVKNNIKYASLIDTNLFGSIEFYNKCLYNNIKPIIGLEVKINNEIYLLIAKNYNGFKVLSNISSNILEPQKIINNIHKDLIYISDNKEIKNNINIHLDIFYEVFAKNEEDTILKELLNAIKYEKTINDFQIKTFKNKSNYLDFVNSLSDDSKKIILEIVNQIDLKFPKNTNNFINFKTNGNKIDYFYNLIIENIYKKTNNFKNKNKEEYIKRINYEFEIIKNKNFIDYFLVVQDFINYAKQNNIIIGPGRGSSAGSLISYALNITEIDPLEYNLLFERFLNEDRCIMPDIDIDIMDNKRELIIQYISNKYGKENVTHIITFSRFKVKMALRDLGRILNIPLQKIDNITKEIIDDNDIELSIKKSNFLQKEYLNFPFLFKFAKKIINIPRQYSIHAAGIVLSEKPISSIVPILNIDNKIITQYSMEYLEELGLIKIDLLGLKNLTIIKMIIDKIKNSKNIDINIYKIPKNDANVFKFLSEGNTLGIFQLESPGMTRLIKKVQPKNLEDISIASALFRPGAFNNIDLYLENKKNNNFNYFNDQMKSILEPTYGTIIYQEQIIDIVKKVSNFSPSESDTFRKAISKKNKNEILMLKEKFIENGMKNNYDKKILIEIFNFMMNFASYGFNHSHSISYSLISYIIAYLKYYFPIETFSVLLTTSLTKNKLNNYYNELIKLGIELEQPNINISNQDFLFIDNKIYFSFNSIQGISSETSNKIINIRNKLSNGYFDSVINALILLISNNINKNVIENLVKIGAFDDLEKNREFLLNSLEFIKINKKDILINKQIWNNYYKNNYNENINFEQYKKWELEILGITFTNKNDSNYNDLIRIEIIPNNIEEKISKNNKKIKIISSIIKNKKIFFYIFNKELLELRWELNKSYFVEILNVNKNGRNFKIINKLIKEI